MKKPGVVLDSRFLDHVTPDDHPEHARRLEQLFEQVDPLENQGRIVRIAPRQAVREEILLVHSEEYFARVEATRIREFTALDPETPACPHSFHTALFAAGGSLEALDAVVSGRVGTALVLSRPPGHHAEINRSMGYCIFNNVAIAAAYARRVLSIQRVAIVDWDVHHGNGTQHIFEKDPSVLFVSVHQFPHFPGSGLYTETGLGPGEGYTVNVPLPKGYGDAEYAALFQDLIRPVVLEFDPELILVSAGFDIQDSDPMGAMGVTPMGFAALTRSVLLMAEACMAHTLFVLEGGYYPDGLYQSVAAVLNELTGATVTDPERLAETADPGKVRFALTRTGHVHQAFWNCWRKDAQ